MTSVQVLGGGISNTFHHHHHHHQSEEDGERTQMTLAKKTSGFLAAVTASQKRIVLAWAESGHGIGRHGDRLKASEHVLGNARWASRAIKLARLLNLDLTSPFDQPTTPTGSFQAGHVEVKLATHAAMLLIQLARRSGAPVTAGSALTRENLMQLGRLGWSDGSPIHFEVYVSRKNCHRCGAFLDRLQTLTGARFDLKQGTRVVPMQYHQQQLKAAKQLGLGRSIGAPGGKRRITATKLQTYEKDGIIHYVSSERDELVETSQAPASIRIPIRTSPYHLFDVDKPLPATPVTEAPDSSASSAKETDAEDVTRKPANDLPFPPRSPRPYSMSLH